MELSMKINYSPMTEVKCCALLPRSVTLCSLFCYYHCTSIINTAFLPIQIFNTLESRLCYKMPADDSHQGSEKRRAIEISDQDTESQSSGASENAASYDTPRKPRLKRQYYKSTSLNDTLAPEPRRREY